jgi:hypothetical protein
MLAILNSGGRLPGNRPATETQRKALLQAPAPPAPTFEVADGARPENRTSPALGTSTGLRAVGQPGSPSRSLPKQGRLPARACRAPIRYPMSAPFVSLSATTVTMRAGNANRRGPVDRQPPVGIGSNPKLPKSAPDGVDPAPRAAIELADGLDLKPGRRGHQLRCANRIDDLSGNRDGSSTRRANKLDLSLNLDLAAPDNMSGPAGRAANLTSVTMHGPRRAAVGFGSTPTSICQAVSIKICTYVLAVSQIVVCSGRAAACACSKECSEPSRIVTTSSLLTIPRSTRRTRSPLITAADPTAGPRTFSICVIALPIGARRARYALIYGRRWQLDFAVQQSRYAILLGSIPTPARRRQPLGKIGARENASLLQRFAKPPHGWPFRQPVIIQHVEAGRHRAGTGRTSTHTQSCGTDRDHRGGFNIP